MSAEGSGGFQLVLMADPTRGYARKLIVAAAIWPTAARSAFAGSQRRMYCVSLRLWTCKRSLLARALSLPTPILQVNTPLQQTTSSLRSPSVTLEQLLPVPSRRLFWTAPPADPSPQGTSRELDIGSTKEGRQTSTGTAQTEGTRSAGDDGGEERLWSAAGVDGENENTAASSSPFAFPEKPPAHQTFHTAAAPGDQRPQPRTPRPDNRTKRPPKSAHAVAMEEFAALERKLAARSAAPPTTSRSPSAEEVTANTNINSSSRISGNGDGNGNIDSISRSNGSIEKRRTAEQVAMEEFAALERKLGSADGDDSQGPKERAVSSGNRRSPSAAAAARPKVSCLASCARGSKICSCPPPANGMLGGTRWTFIRSRNIDDAKTRLLCKQLLILTYVCQ